MDNPKKIEKKVLVFPSFADIDQLSIAELTKIKVVAENLADYVAHKIRQKIQR